MADAITIDALVMMLEKRLEYFKLKQLVEGLKRNADNLSVHVSSKDTPTRELPHAKSHAPFIIKAFEMELIRLHAELSMMGYDVDADTLRMSQTQGIPAWD